MLLEMYLLWLKSGLGKASDHLFFLNPLVNIYHWIKIKEILRLQVKQVDSEVDLCVGVL